MTFITAYYHNGSILLVVIVVILLLCLIYKLNFCIGMYVWGKTIYIGFNNIHDLRHPVGVSEHIPQRLGETIIKNSSCTP